MAIAVTLHKVEEASAEQADFVARSCRLLGTALNHSAFHERMARAVYKETRHQDAEGRLSSIEPAKVIAFILGGRESGTADDGEIDLHIRLAKLPRPRWWRAGTVGETELGQLPFKTAYWFIDGCMKDGDQVSPASHFIHEWLHVAGFYHYPDNDARDDVPYVVGEIVRHVLTDDMPEKGLVVSPKMARQFANSRDLTHR